MSVPQRTYRADAVVDRIDRYRDQIRRGGYSLTPDFLRRVVAGLRVKARLREIRSKPIGNAPTE